MTRVDAPANGARSRSEPTPTILPSRTARALAQLRAASIVAMRPPVRTRSAAGWGVADTAGSGSGFGPAECASVVAGLPAHPIGRDTGPGRRPGRTLPRHDLGAPAPRRLH